MACTSHALDLVLIGSELENTVRVVPNEEEDERGHEPGRRGSPASHHTRETGADPRELQSYRQDEDPERQSLGAKELSHEVALGVG